MPSVSQVIQTELQRVAEAPVCFVSKVVETDLLDQRFQRQNFVLCPKLHRQNLQDEGLVVSQVMQTELPERGFHSFVVPSCRDRAARPGFCVPGYTDKTARHVVFVKPSCRDGIARPGVAEADLS